MFHQNEFQMKVKFLIWAVSLVVLQSCMADLRPSLIKKEGITSHNELKGKKILQESWERQGFDKLHQFTSYSFHGEDVWKGMMGRLGKPWPDAKSNMFFRFEIGTFDSQVKYLDGKKANTYAGLQSWHYYEFPEGNSPKRLKMNYRRRFGLSAYQYFFEMLDRIKQAPIVSWAGSETFNGEQYDIIFATWHKTDPHMGHDQYKLLINKKTKRLDYTIYTLRENYLKMPGARAFFGSVKYSDFKEIDGIFIPHTQTIFLNNPKKKDKKNLHVLKVKDFQFDSFDLNLLKPFSDIRSTGNSKEKG